jgi:hypothetical protein
MHVANEGLLQTLHAPFHYWKKMERDRWVRPCRAQHTRDESAVMARAETMPKRGGLGISLAQAGEQFMVHQVAKDGQFPHRLAPGDTIVSSSCLSHNELVAFAFKVRTHRNYELTQASWYFDGMVYVHVLHFRS